MVGLAQKGRPAPHDPSFSQKDYHGVSFAGSQIYGSLQGHVSLGDHIKIFTKISLGEDVFPRLIILHPAETGDVPYKGFFKALEKFTFSPGFL